jgi:3-hydroxyacyl-CoA dehydrogenase
MAHLINRVAVIGSGTMGGALAAHFANAGIPAYLLDIAPNKLTPEEEKKGLTLKDPVVRNRIVNAGLDAIKKARPAALFTPAIVERITVGNLEDNFDFIKEADWIIEVIVENLKIKQDLMARIDAVRKPDSIVTTNTSGIPIKDICAGRSASFQQHFLGTHFFNPPRYLKLLEIIPSPKTSPDVLKFVMDFGETVLGKGIVLCKDRPNFVANRIGTQAGIFALKYTLEHGYSFSEVDDFTGPIIGHPKTASYRLLDLVGIDVMYHVAKNLYDAVPEDESREDLKEPGILGELVKRGWLGNKTKQGFYKEVRVGDKREFHVLDPKTMEYHAPQKVHYESITNAEFSDTLGEKLRYIVSQNDRAAQFIWDTTARSLAYASNRVPEIADEIYAVDNAMKWGFANEAGPFEVWDMLGVAETVARMEKDGIQVAPWVKKMLKTGHPTFYKGNKYYDLKKKDYVPLPQSKNVIVLKKKKTVTSNDNAALLDLGDGVACLEFRTKMNALDAGIIEVAQTALEEVDKNFLGMVIGSQSEAFSAGANVMSIYMAAEEKQWDTIDDIAKALQNFLMAVRYSPKPVVTAPYQYTLGGGCEVAMAGARVCAHAESYVGLVEVGMGLIPAGGGCKEMLRRVVSPAMLTPNTDPLPFVQRVFETIGLGKVATSAEEAKQMGFFTPADRVVMNREQLIAEAKRMVLDLAAAGYRPPARGKIIYAAGERMLAALRVALHMMIEGKYATEHDGVVGRNLAYILCGGNITSPTWVDEQYILDLEREMFISLCGEQKTRDRISHFLNTGKILRN